MSPTLSASASALGLYKYNCSGVTPDLLQSFHERVTKFSNDFGIQLTYFGAGGTKSSGKFRKVKGRSYRTLLDSGFAGATSLELVANPSESDAPAFDSFVYTSINCTPVTRELSVVISINESFVRFGSPEYARIVSDTLSLATWDCGYGFSDSAASSPELRLMSMTNRKESAQEYASLCAWHAASTEVRRTRMRDVYPYNLLNDAQLAAPAVDGMSLREFAERQPDCSLTRATEYGLHLWRVPEESVPRLRDVLAGSHALIASR